MALEANRNYRVQIWLLPSMAETWWSISTEDITGLLGRVQAPVQEPPRWLRARTRSHIKNLRSCGTMPNFGPAESVQPSEAFVWIVCKPRISEPRISEGFVTIDVVHPSLVLIGSYHWTTCGIVRARICSNFGLRGQ